MNSRSIRLLLLVVLLLCLPYFIVVVRYHEAGLRGWTYALKSDSWSRTWLSYNLQHPPRFHEDLQTTSRTGHIPSQEVVAENCTHTAASPAVRTPKVPLNRTGPTPYAYVLPIDSNELACAALINIDRLRNAFHTRYRIIALVDGDIAPEYLEALRNYNVTVQPTLPPRPKGSKATDYTSFLALKAFDIHSIDNSLTRVLMLEADSLMLRSPDSVFDLPVVDIAIPRAYWTTLPLLNSAFVLISPSNRVGEMVGQEAQKAEPGTSADDIINRVFKHTALILPGSYGTRTSHWDEWSIPDWYRPEEVVEMEEAGHITGDHDLVQQGTPGDIAALGWAIDRWKDDYEETGEDDASWTYKAEGDIEDTAADGRAVTESYLDRSTGRMRPKRDLDEADQGHHEVALRKSHNVRDTTFEDPGHMSSTEAATVSGVLKLSESQESWQPIASNSDVDNADDPSTSAADEPTLPTTTPNTAQLAAEVVTFDGEEAMPNLSISAPVNTALDELSTTSSAPSPIPVGIDKAALISPLFDLHRVVHVLQFAQDEKPWQRDVEGFRVDHSDAHQLWLEHYRQWREMAKKVCPAVNRSYWSEHGEQWKAEKLVERV